MVLVKEGLTFTSCTSSLMSTLMLLTMGAFAKTERSMMLECLSEGIAAAKAAGKPSERPGRLKQADIAANKARCAAG